MFLPFGIGTMEINQASNIENHLELLKDFMNYVSNDNHPFRANSTSFNSFYLNDKKIMWKPNLEEMGNFDLSENPEFGLITKNGLMDSTVEKMKQYGEFGHTVDYDLIQQCVYMVIDEKVKNTTLVDTLHPQYNLGQLFTMYCEQLKNSDINYDSVKNLIDNQNEFALAYEKEFNIPFDYEINTYELSAKIVNQKIPVTIREITNEEFNGISEGDCTTSLIQNGLLNIMQNDKNEKKKAIENILELYKDENVLNSSLIRLMNHNNVSIMDMIDNEDNDISFLNVFPERIPANGMGVLSVVHVSSMPLIDMVTMNLARELLITNPDQQRYDLKELMGNGKSLIDLVSSELRDYGVSIKQQETGLINTNTGFYAAFGTDYVNEHTQQDITVCMLMDNVIPLSSIYVDSVIRNDAFQPQYGKYSLYDIVKSQLDFGSEQEYIKSIEDFAETQDNVTNKLVKLSFSDINPAYQFIYGSMQNKENKIIEKIQKQINNLSQSDINEINDEFEMLNNHASEIKHDYVIKVLKDKFAIDIDLLTMELHNDITSGVKNKINDNNIISQINKEYLMDVLSNTKIGKRIDLQEQIALHFEKLVGNKGNNLELSHNRNKITY